MTRSLLLWYLKYDRTRAVLIWKNHHDKATATKFKGKIAGRMRDGHKQVSINNKQYLVHRIIWFLEKNEWPNFIDHIDGDPSNNKLSNLRNVDNRKNQQNRHTHRKGKLVGTTYHKKNNAWMARIVVKRKIIYLGCYGSEREAHKAYMNRLKEIGDQHV